MRKGEKQRENLKLHRLSKDGHHGVVAATDAFNDFLGGRCWSSTRDGPIPKRGSHPQCLFQWMNLLRVSEMPNPKS